MPSDSGAVVPDDRFAELRERIGRRFHRAEPRRRAWMYITSLLSDEVRKNAWAISLRAGERSPDGMQRMLRNADWDADGVRDDVRHFVVERLRSPADSDGVLVVGETEFVKRGNRTVAVEQQFAPRLQRLENCQIGVFAGYVTGRGCGLIDRELYLPESWAASSARRRAAGVPDGVSSTQRPELARRIVDRGVRAGVPIGCVVSTEPYGRHTALLDWLDQRNVPYVLGMDGPGLSDVSGADDPAQPPEVISLSPLMWTRIPSSSKGLRGRDRWILSYTGPRAVRFVCDGRSGVSLASVVRAVTASMAFRRCVETARHRAGLDDYQLRTWSGWYRHITLSLAASACLSVP